MRSEPGAHRLLRYRDVSSHLHYQPMSRADFLSVEALSFTFSDVRLGYRSGASRLEGAEPPARPFSPLVSPFPLSFLPPLC